MASKKTPPTTAELLEKFKKKVPGLPEKTYQEIHELMCEARTTVTLMHAEMRLANQNKQQEDADK